MLFLVVAYLAIASIILFPRCDTTKSGMGEIRDQ